jgi:hypothetical protein
MRGVDLRTIRTPLESRDLRMTMRYSRLSPEHLRKAVQNLDKSLTLKEGIRDKHFSNQYPNARLRTSPTKSDDHPTLTIDDLP